MRTVRRTLLVVALSLVAFASAVAQSPEPPGQADIYLFWSRTCPHCERALQFLERLASARPSLRLHVFEVEGEGAGLFRRINETFAIGRPAVPTIVIGAQVLIGYGDDETTGASIARHVEACLAHGCPDLVRPLLATVDAVRPAIERPRLVPAVRLPLLGEVETGRLSLPLLTVVMAAVDGFNPCAMWGLVFLLGLLVGIKEPRRRWLLGGTFVAVSAAVYFAIISAWLNLLLLLGALVWIRIAVGLAAVAGGVYYLREFARGDVACRVTASAGRRRALDRLKDMAQRPSLAASVLGVAALAVAVNLIDLLCSAGVPAVFTEVLAQSRLPLWQYYAYLALYIVVFMADDMLVFVTAMTTLSLTGLGQGYVRVASLAGGIVLTAVGALLLLRPEWLSFR